VRESHGCVLSEALGDPMPNSVFDKNHRRVIGKKGYAREDVQERRILGSTRLGRGSQGLRLRGTSGVHRGECVPDGGRASGGRLTATPVIFPRVSW
jgi:hypothetical protein